MLRLASDADVHGEIIRGLRRRIPEIDLVRVQDCLPEGTSDPEVLSWAAAENRILITNDRNTMVGFAYERAETGKTMPGLRCLDELAFRTVRVNFDEKNHARGPCFAVVALRE